MISILACPSAHVQLGFRTFHPGHLIPLLDIFSQHPIGQLSGKPPLITPIKFWELYTASKSIWSVKSLWVRFVYTQISFTVKYWRSWKARYVIVFIVKFWWVSDSILFICLCSVLIFSKNYFLDYWGRTKKRFCPPILIIGGTCQGCPQSLRLCLQHSSSHRLLIWIFVILIKMLRRLQGIRRPCDTFM